MTTINFISRSFPPMMLTPTVLVQKIFQPKGKITLSCTADIENKEIIMKRGTNWDVAKLVECALRCFRNGVYVDVNLLERNLFYKNNDGAIRRINYDYQLSNGAEESDLSEIISITKDNTNTRIALRFILLEEDEKRFFHKYPQNVSGIYLRNKAVVKLADFLKCSSNEVNIVALEGATANQVALRCLSLINAPQFVKPIIYWFDEGKKVEESISQLSSDLKFILGDDDGDLKRVAAVLDEKGPWLFVVPFSQRRIVELFDSMDMHQGVFILINEGRESLDGFDLSEFEIIDVEELRDDVVVKHGRVKMGKQRSVGRLAREGSSQKVLPTVAGSGSYILPLRSTLLSFAERHPVLAAMDIRLVKEPDDSVTSLGGYSGAAIMGVEVSQVPTGVMSPHVSTSRVQFPEVSLRPSKKVKASSASGDEGSEVDMET